MKVADVQALLEARWPQADAEPWDRVGLQVGEPTQPVTHIACALDADLDTIRRAHELGADLLVTHHPTYILEYPDSCPSFYGREVEETAQELGLALIACHTNLDASEEARLTVGEGLPLKPLRMLREWRDTGDNATDVPLCFQVWKATKKVTVKELAEALAKIYNAAVRCSVAPGMDDAEVRVVASVTGSGGDFINEPEQFRQELLITGELKYHQRLEASDHGLSTIELGHDVSEWPLVTLLYDALKPFCEKHDTKITLMTRPERSEVICP